MSILRQITEILVRPSMVRRQIVSNYLDKVPVPLRPQLSWTLARTLVASIFVRDRMGQSTFPCSPAVHLRTPPFNNGASSLIERETTWEPNTSLSPQHNLWCNPFPKRRRNLYLFCFKKSLAPSCMFLSDFRTTQPLAFNNSRRRIAFLPQNCYVLGELPVLGLYFTHSWPIYFFCCSRRISHAQRPNNTSEVNLVLLRTLEGWLG